jgi:NAD(P)H dehydrogenase (quinone)
MHAITGITGTVGAQVARILLGKGQPVRAVLRDPSKTREWTESGCEVAIASLDDASALTRAFTDCESVFVLPPPNFDPAPGFPEVKAVITAVRAALLAARPSRVVCISTIGAQATSENLLTQLSLVENALRDLPMPVAFLRPGWFIENVRWDVPAVRQTGTLSSFLQPVDKPFPMVATADIATTVARLLQETWTGSRVVELEGPTRVSPNDLAATFSRLLHKPIRAEVVARETWEPMFRAQGMANPTPRMQMLDGFNEGWIEFESGAAPEKGTTSVETVLSALLRSTD